MNGYRMPSRVNAIKWLGVLQLIHGILVFIITIVLFAIDFEASHRTTPSAGSGVFHPRVIYGFLLAFLAMGAGVAGASMSRYEGLIHNVSSKNACMALSVMNAFAAIMYMAIEGTMWFWTVDQNNFSLSSQQEPWRAAFAMVVIIFILAFFDMIVAFMTVILCALWLPREQSNASPYVSERVVEEPYVVREERVPYGSRSHTGAYGRPAYDYYGGGYRTLPPALKY